MKKIEIQFCPKCASKNIKISDRKLGNPVLEQGMFGWECIDCGYQGKDFFITNEINYKKIKSKIRKNKLK